MTSRTGVEAVVRELSFGWGGSAHDPAAEAAFRFALDFDGPLQWPDLAYDTASRAAHPAAAQRTRLRAVLDETAQTMAQRVPAAFALVDTQMQHVLLRSHAGSAGGSASHRSHIGSCLLTNLHESAHAVPVAIEALTHESIHQLIYRIEHTGGPFCDLAEMPTYRSPWSGARLPLHSLVHASFVWFGLLTLWNEMALRPATPDEAAHARGRVAHCLFGFAFLEDLLDSPGFPLTGIAPDVLEAMRGMAAASRRATAAAEPVATLRQTAAARHGASWPQDLAAAGMAPPSSVMPA